jgi:hypothetical protein
MTAIAISYRREDTLQITGRIYDRLVSHYGDDAVFRDIDTRTPGFDFRQKIREHMDRCDILLVIIGSNWRGPVSDGSFRIDEEADFVRQEVEIGLARKIPVIPVLISPVLVNNVLTPVSMPTAAQLPPSLKELSYRDDIIVDPGGDFDFHINRLIDTMNGIFARLGIKVSPPQHGARDTLARVTSASILMLAAAALLLLVALYRLSRAIESIQRAGVGVWFERSSWNLPEFVILICFAPLVAYSTLRGGVWSRAAALATCAFGVFNGLYFIFNPVSPNNPNTERLLAYTLVYAFCLIVYAFRWRPPLGSADKT